MYANPLANSIVTLKNDDKMKKIYQAPTSQTFEIRTNGVLALSLNNDPNESVTNTNKDEFEQLTQKKNNIWGNDTYDSNPW